MSLPKDQRVFAAVLGTTVGALVLLVLGCGILYGLCYWFVPNWIGWVLSATWSVLIARSWFRCCLKAIRKEL